MARLRNRKPQATPGPDLRGYLRDRLTGLRDRVAAMIGDDPDGWAVYGRAYGLSRLDGLNEGQGVTVKGYEISGALSAAARHLVTPAEDYTLTAHGKLVRLVRNLD